MRKRTIAMGLIAASLLAGGGWLASLDPEARALLATFPTNRDVLSWNQDQRDAAFRATDRLPLLAQAQALKPAELSRANQVDLALIKNRLASQIWSDELNVPVMMNVLLLCYFLLVGLLVWLMTAWENRMRVPGFGT